MLVELDVDGHGHGKVSIDGQQLVNSTQCHIAVKVGQRPSVIITMRPDRIVGSVDDPEVDFTEEPFD